jgi:hypothetical protein
MRLAVLLCELVLSVVGIVSLLLGAVHYLGQAHHPTAPRRRHSPVVIAIVVLLGLWVGAFLALDALHDLRSGRF